MRNLQQKHDDLVARLRNPNLPTFIRPFLRREQRELARDLYLINPGATVLKPIREKHKNDYTENIYVNKAFDSSSLMRAIMELRSIQTSRKGKGKVG